MALSATVYNWAKSDFLKGNIDLDTSAKCALLTTAYTPDIDSHRYWSDVSAYEVAGTGYTAGGATLTNVSTTVDTANDRAYIDADDTSWSNATLSNLRYAVIYYPTGDPATSPLVGYINFGSTKSLTDGTFTIAWDSGGVIRIT